MYVQFQLKTNHKTQPIHVFQLKLTKMRCINIDSTDCITQENH